MSTTNSFFETAKPLNLFFKVAIPGLISMLAMSLYIAFEGMFVGKCVGATAFAAINIGFPLVMVNNSLADLIGVGSSVPISVSLGKKDNNYANNVFTCSVIMIIALAVFMGAVMFFAAPVILRLMGADGELAALAVKYIRVYALLGPVTTIVFAMDNYLRISGFVKDSMLLNIFMSLLTVGLLALFLGVMDKGIEWAAFATCISMFICAVIAVIPFIRKTTVLNFVKPHLTFGMVKDIVSYGSPIFLSNVAGRAAAIILNAALISMGGETAVATYSVMLYAAGVIEPMLYGMSDSIQPALGYNWGAGLVKRVKSIAAVTFTVCGIVSVCCTLFMWMFPELLTSIFVSPEETEIIEMSVKAIPLFGTAFIFGWFGFAVQGFFGAIEKPLPAMVMSVARAFVFPVVLIYALSFMGLNGLWINYAVSSLLAAVMAIFMLMRTKLSDNPYIKKEAE